MVCLGATHSALTHTIALSKFSAHQAWCTNTGCDCIVRQVAQAIFQNESLRGIELILHVFILCPVLALSGCSAHLQAAALKLAYMEYADLDIQERLALLQGLIEQALDCEDVRDLITSKVEALSVPRQPKKPVSLMVHFLLKFLMSIANLLAPRWSRGASLLKTGTSSELSGQRRLPMSACEGQVLGCVTIKACCCPSAALHIIKP